MQGSEKLLFNFEVSLYKYTCLRNSPTIAPIFFIKILKPVFLTLTKGHKNTFLKADTFEWMQKFSSSKCRTNFKPWRFFIHPDISKLFPSREIEFLGFMINSTKMAIRLSAFKQSDNWITLEGVETIKELIITEIAELIRKLKTALPGIQYSKLDIWYLHKPEKNTALKKANGNYDRTCIFKKNAKIESQWWSVLSSNEIFSDVCLTVWKFKWRELLMNLKIIQAFAIWKVLYLLIWNIWIKFLFISRRQHFS